MVGAGLGGLAVAARLAKLGHVVTVLERRDVAGGAITRIEHEGFSWDAGPTSTPLPAVLRDLFRKSGRPLEQYADLVLQAPGRRHVFEDRTVVDLPTGSRASQITAIDAGLGEGTGASWAGFVDALGPVWDSLRRSVLDVPDGGGRFADRPVAQSLSARTSLAKLVARAFKDERLRAMAELPVRLAGSEPKDTPAFVAVDHYVDRSFGVWGVPGGGLAAITEALLIRISERKVALQLGTEVSRIVVDDDGGVRGVETAGGQVWPADVVICDVDPRAVFTTLLPAGLDLPGRRIFTRATPAIPVAVTHLGLAGDVPDLPDEVVLHGEPLLAVHTTGTAPPGQCAWTIHRRGSAQEDVLLTMARRGVDVRKAVVTRLDRSSVDLIQETGGSSYGLAWAGWRAHVQRAAQTHPLPGLYLLGASMHPGASVPYVAWGAANVATRLGKAT